jgi:hypothetical protein
VVVSIFWDSGLGGFPNMLSGLAQICCGTSVLGLFWCCKCRLGFGGMLGKPFGTVARRPATFASRASKLD